MSEKEQNSVVTEARKKKEEIAQLYISAFAKAGTQELQSDQKPGVAERSLNLYHALIELGADQYWEQIKDDSEVLGMIANAKDDAYHHKAGATVQLDKVHNIIETALESKGDLKYLEDLVRAMWLRQAIGGF